MERRELADEEFYGFYKYFGEFDELSAWNLIAIDCTPPLSKMRAEDLVLLSEVVRYEHGAKPRYVAAFMTLMCWLLLHDHDSVNLLGFKYRETTPTMILKYYEHLFKLWENHKQTWQGRTYRRHDETEEEFYYRCRNPMQMVYMGKPLMAWA